MIQCNSLLESLKSAVISILEHKGRYIMTVKDIINRTASDAIYFNEIKLFCFHYF